MIEMPQIATQSAGALSSALLVCALFMVGTELSRQTVARIRGKALMHALLLWGLVVPGTLVIILNLG